MLRTVVTDGTARKPFQGAPYSVAGKTGTALVADGRAGYSNKVYQSSFVGYFPADDPQYSCIVVVRSQPHPRIYYGADVAAPVFRRIADQLYALHQGPNATPRMPEPRVDSIRWGVRTLSTRARLLAGNWPAVPVYALDKQSTTTSADRLADDRMPDLTGVGLRDAVRLLENKGLKVSFAGAGRVVKQSLPAGTPIRPGQQIQLILN